MMNCETCHQDGVGATAIRSTKSRHCGSPQPSEMSNQPRGNGPRCEARMLRAMKLASSVRAGRIAACDRPAAIISGVLQRDAELGFGLGLDLVQRDAVGELDQRHPVLAVLVDGEDGQIRHHHVYY